MYADKTVMGRWVKSLIMIEVGKWKTTREVTRNTCNPKHHLDKFTGSKSLMVGLFGFLF